MVNLMPDEKVSLKKIALRSMYALERIATVLEAIHKQNETERLRGEGLASAMNRVADGLTQYIEKTWYSVRG
jgi:hypothetical protein